MVTDSGLSIEQVVGDNETFWAVIDMKVRELMAKNPKLRREDAQEMVFGDVINPYSMSHSSLYAVRDESKTVIASALGVVHPGMISLGGKNSFEIVDVFVDPSRRNHRISYHVTAYMLNAAKEAGFSEVFAKVPFKDKVPQRLFSRLGFQWDYTELNPNLRPSHNVYSKILR